MTASPRDQLEIHLFGGFSVLYAGEQLPPLPSRPARLLFAWLVLQAGRPQPRTLLADRFWPDLAEARARRRLSHALWQVQDSLSERAPDHPYLLTPADAVTFDAAAPYWLDVEEFERRLDRVDADGSIDGAALRNLRRCVELYHGDLLAGHYEPWVLAEQDRLRQRYITALGRLVEACKQRGGFEEALTFARRLTHQAPLREDAHREVMRLCVLLGQPSQALEQYERCRSVLAEELGTEPSAATVELRHRIAETRAVGVSRRSPAQQLISRRLIGRDDERVTLVDQLERTLAGSTGMVFVEGEAGIGKTQLLTQAADDARWRGFSVLWGTCSGPDVPYAAIRQALLPELGPVRVAQLRAHVEPVWLQDAGHLLPPLAADEADVTAAEPSAAALSGADATDRMREALVRVLVGLAAIDPVVLVIEDAHRADQETLGVLRTLARRTTRGRLLVMLSFRDVDAREDEPVWSGLRAIDREVRATRISLQPLTAFETAGLLREVLGTSEVPAAFTGSVHREGGGNPLYVLELLRALRDAGSLSERGGEQLDALSVPVTDGLRTLIGDRLGFLDPAADGVVRLAAVLGPELDLTTLQLGSGLDRRELTGILGELVRRNVLEVAGETCRFTHAATRRVVLTRIDDQEARDLHAAAGAALEATHPEQVEALAAHFRQADAPHRALPYLRAAADRATQLHAYATAATHLQAAATLSERTPLPAGERFQLLARLETTLGVLGRRDQQETILDQLDTVVGADPGQQVDVHVRRAIYLGHVDRFDDATAAARRADALASATGDDALRGRALTALGQVLSWSGANEHAAQVLQEAVTLLDDRPADAVQAHFVLGTALRFLQRFERAAEALERSLQLAEGHDDQVGVVQALGALADLHAETGRTEEAVARYDHAVALARRIGYRHREGVGLVNLGTVRLARAEPLPALDAYDQAATLFASLGNHRGTAIVQLNRAWAQHRWLGRDDDAERDARAAHHHFEEVGNHGIVAACLETLAGVARARGELERAAAHLAAGLDAAKAVGDQRAEVQILRGQTELALARDDAAQAHAHAEAGMALVRRLGISEFAADLRSLGALALLAQQDLSGAWHAAEEAVADIATSGEPHRIHHRVALVAAATGHEEAHERHALAAYHSLMDALAELEAPAREPEIDAVPEHAAIVATGRAISPRRLTLRMARQDAPRGRALQRGETVPVELLLAPPPSSPDERRNQLLQVIRQVHEQAAQATVDDLASTFEVSASTIRRDLRALRSQGHDLATRGTGTG